MIKNNKKSSNSIVGGLFWTFSERITAQIVTAIVTIVLARLLDPFHYGLISIVTIFITFLNIFVSSGLGSAVVQKKNVTEEDFNTAFVISFSLSLLLYIILFLCAPVIASFYEMPELTLVMRVMGIRLIVASLNTIQHAYIQRQMKFKKFFFATLFGTIVSAIVGLLLAFNGFGVWALVAQYLTNTTVDTIVLFFVTGWKPKFIFILKSAKRLLSFGWKVLATELIFTLESDIRSLIVGKIFGAADLAYYDQGKRYPSLFVTNINTSINKVMLPAYSRTQDDIEKLKNMLRKSIQIGTFILSPLLIGFALISSSFVMLLLTDKWMGVVPYIQIFCVVYLTRPLETSCHQALLAIGDSGRVMKIMLGINFFALITVLIGVFVFKSVFATALGSLVTAFVSLTLFLKNSSIRLGYNVREQLSDIFPPLVASAFMGIIVFFIGLADLSPLLEIIIQILCGGVIYIIISYKFKIEGFVYIIGKLSPLLKKKKWKEEKLCE